MAITRSAHGHASPADLRAAVSAIPVWLVDHEGVLGPVLRSTPQGSAIHTKLVDFIATQRRIPVRLVEAEMSRLKEKFGTDALLYAMHLEYGIPYSKMISRIYFPELNELRRHIPPDPELSMLLRSLQKNGKRILVLSNSNAYVVQAMLDAMNVYGVFDGILTVESFGGPVRPKPYAEADLYALVRARNSDRVPSPHDALFADDNPENLTAPKQLGMLTVLVGGRPCREKGHLRVDTFKEVLRAAL